MCAAETSAQGTKRKKTKVGKESSTPKMKSKLNHRSPSKSIPNIRQAGMFSDGSESPNGNSPPMKHSSPALYNNDDDDESPSTETRGKTPTKSTPKDGPKIDYDSFIRAVERGMSDEEAIQKVI